MFSRQGSIIVLLSGSALATAGWAAVFPFLYADISTARGLGAAAAAGTFSAFAVGSILTAPIAGWLADTFNPARVAVMARVALALFTAILGLVHTELAIWLAAAGFGAAVAVTQPAVQVLLLDRTRPEKRRDVFAWQFVAVNLGTAAGAALGGLLVNLSSQATMRPLYEVATVAALLSALLIPRTPRTAMPEPSMPGPAVPGLSVPGLSVTSGLSVPPVPETSYREVLASRQVRCLLVVALLITLACYAQYDSGLPAYLLSSTSITPAQLGGAVAVNAVLVGLLTAPVVALTRGRRSTSLLATCAGLWVVCWLVFALPLHVHGADVLFIFIGFIAMSFGETMMAPILSALAATLAPPGAAGRTMAAVTGASTVATAVGPLLAAAFIGSHLPDGFIAMQVLFCAAAGAAALTLNRISRRPAIPVDRTVTGSIAV